nr:MAG TPA: hypothetical protein [Caudoviricetes sp.]
MKIENMKSTKGNKVANQFIIEFNNYTAFQSYSTLIAVYSHENDTLYLDEKKYSVTTSKYTNMFIEQYQPLTISKVDNNSLHRIIERG